MPWPDKNKREKYEISGFIKAYKILPHGRELEVLTKREKPDYFVSDAESGEIFGVELTSVYLSDRSVPDEHIPPITGPTSIPYSPSEILQYGARIVGAVIGKVNKAQKDYDLSHPLLLSIYVNDHRSIFMEENDWEDIVKANEHIFDSMHPFSEVVLWGLVNRGVFSIRPERRK